MDLGYVELSLNELVSRNLDRLKNNKIYEDESKQSSSISFIVRRPHYLNILGFDWPEAIKSYQFQKIIAHQLDGFQSGNCLLI